ncbi:MAG: hypothetical protein HOH04_13830, partial [Rhodospirillaceae bacterium]|nr:hypothetical protein [Rhodospirillaceae bacterium]
MAEDINVEEEEFEEEEEEQGADAQQTLDDLTVLNEGGASLDDVDEQGAGDDSLEWEEPAASQSLATIHTGSRPTDAELMANLIPEGDATLENEEIAVIEEDPQAELPDVAPPEVGPDAERRPEPQAEQAREPEPPQPDGAPPEEPAPPVEAAPDEDPVVPEAASEEVAAAAAEVVQEDLPVTPPPTLPPEEEDDDVVEVEDIDVEDATGSEDSAIALDIDAGDATEVTIEGVPDGATLSAGTDNGDGTWTVSAGDLDDLTITPPADSDVDFTLSVTGDGPAQELDVTVNAVADAPAATAEDASGQEDTAIDLDLGSALSDVDGSESLSVTISNIPDGAVLSAGTDNGDGTWSLSATDLDGLQITPPQDFAGDMDLTLTATSTEADGGDTAVTEVPFTVTVVDTVDATDAVTTEDQAVSLDISYPDGTTTGTISDIPDGAVLMSGGQVITITDGSADVTADQLADLTITPPADSGDDFVLQVTADGVTQDLGVTVSVDADGADVSASDATGTQGSEIPLTGLGAELTADTDGSETISAVVIDISDAPDGTVLSTGTDNGDGTWTVDQSDLATLSVTPPANYAGDFDVTMTVTSVDTGDTPGDTDSATDSITFNVSISADGSFAVTDAVGNEDTAIALSIDPGAATSVVISDVPDGATLSAGTDNGDGTWSLSLTDLNDLTITPPADSDVDFTLQVTAGGETVPLDVRVDAVADAPTATAEDATGTEGTAVPLDLGTALTDTDASETLSVTIDISQAPDGTTFSAGTDNGDGTWSVDVSDLAGLSVTPPSGFFGDIDFTLISTSTEADGGDTATTEVPFTVTLASDGDFGVSIAEGIEDQAIALTIDDGGAATVTIADVPDGATLSAGTDNGDGTWTLTSAQLDGLTITPPADSDADFTLQVSAGGETLPLDVTVAADADAPDATAGDVSGTEDTTIPLTLGSALNDLDGSESLSVTISGMPDGAVLSAGTDNGDGTWTVDGGDLATLAITPPTGFDGEIPLTMTATATDTDSETGAVDTETTTVPFTVTVNDDGQDVVFDVTNAEGLEDTAIALDIDPGTATQVTIEDVPEGAILSAGTDNGDGTWTLAAEELEDLTITPPADSDVDFTLNVVADGESQPLDVNVLAVADRPDLEVHSTVGDEDTSIPLSIDSQLTDTDGTETLSMTVDITGIPDGAVLTRNGEELDLTYDAENDSYSVELNPDELGGLAITPPQDFFGDINLQVTSTSTEDDPNAAVSSASTTASFGVTVRPVADNPEISTADASGLEDGAPIPLDVTVGMADGITE